MNDVLRMLNDQGLTAGSAETYPGIPGRDYQAGGCEYDQHFDRESPAHRVQQTGQAPGEIVQAEGLAQVSDDSAIRAVAQSIIETNPKEVQSYKSGKITLIGWFVGQVMRQMRGKADPGLTRTVLEELLSQ